MSTFFHTDNSPLLGQSQMFQYNPNNPIDPYSVYKQQLINQFNNQNPNQIPDPQNPGHDYLSELDALSRGLDKEVLERVETDERYIELNSKIQSCIQNEIMNMVKNKLNANSSLVDDIKEEMDIINKIKNDVKQEERNNYYEMQDYLKNYSHLTFDDYKKLKTTNPKNKNKEKE